MPILKPLLIFLILSCTTTIAQDLDTYQWKNRIILLKETNLDSDWLNAQAKRLQSDFGELNKRELVVFIVADEKVYDLEHNETDLNADTITEQYSLGDFQGLVLIGKDGGVKLKEAFIVNTKTIFELVDSMPMRQQESKDQ